MLLWVCLLVQVVIASQAAVCLCGLWPTGVKRRSEALKNEDRGVGWEGGECVQGKRKKATASPLSGVVSRGVVHARRRTATGTGRGQIVTFFVYRPPSRPLGSLTPTQPGRVTNPTQGHPGPPCEAPQAECRSLRREPKPPA